MKSIHSIARTCKLNGRFVSAYSSSCAIGPEAQVSLLPASHDANHISVLNQQMRLLKSMPISQRTKLMKARVGRAIDSQLARVAVKLGMNLAEPTDIHDVLGLIRKLRPLDCGKELIRIGGAGDGGYLVPDDLDGIEYCFSPGVSVTSSFENHLADLGIRSFLADFSVDSPPLFRPEFTFDKKFLGATDHSQFLTLASWKDKYLKGYGGDLILQMDIEGSEYEVILSTTDQLLDQFRIVLIEFHFLDRLFDRFAFQLFSTCFEKLLDLFYVVHIHPNNCGGSVRRGGIEIPRTMEFTLLNKRRVRSTKPQIAFPHNLDTPNAQQKELVLPQCWYAS